MYMNGYQYNEGTKDDLAKTNPSLLSWKQLCAKMPDMLIYDLLAILICEEKMDENVIRFS